MNDSSIFILPPRPRVATRRKPRSRAFPIAGASLGLVLFLFVALLPTLVYGSEVGMQVATGILGAPDASTVAVSALVALGIVTAVTVVASLFAAAGAAAAALVGALTAAARARLGQDRPAA